MGARFQAMTCSRRKAFTLLEILLVVLVVGFTVAAFLPVALNTADQARTRSFLRQVISLNQYARSRAILDRTPMSVVYNPAEGWVRLNKAAVRNRPPLDLESDLGAEGLDDSEESTVFQRLVPDTLRLRGVEGAREDGDHFVISIDEDGVGTTHTVEVVDPRGEIRSIRFNGFTGEADYVD